MSKSVKYSIEPNRFPGAQFNGRETVIADLSLPSKYGTQNIMDIRAVFFDHVRCILLNGKAENYSPQACRFMTLQASI